MTRIYRLTYGPYYEEYVIGYLTEDKVADYLEELYNSEDIIQYKKNYIDGIEQYKIKYKNKRSEAIEKAQSYTVILHLGKKDPEYKGAKKQFKTWEKIIIDCNWKLKKIDKNLDEVSSWTAVEWLNSAGYRWEPIEINVINYPNIKEED